MFSDYLKSILTAGICAFFCETISNSFGSSKVLSKAMNIVTSLVMICVVILPLCNIISNTANIFSFDKENSNNKDIDKETFLSLTFDNVEDSLKSQILTETGIYCDEISIDFTESESGLEIKEITVMSEGISSENKDIVKCVIVNNFGDKINVTFTENSNGQN